MANLHLPVDETTIRRLDRVRERRGFETITEAALELMATGLESHEQAYGSTKPVHVGQVGRQKPDRRSA